MGRVLQRFILLAAAFGLIAASVLSIRAFVANDSSEEPGPLRAAIVDQLSLTFPSESFVQDATRLLEQAGYIVDYYPGEEVTVEFYRDLPARGADLLIVRAHSGLIGPSKNEPEDAFLFTSELYSYTKYAEERREHRLAQAYAIDFVGEGIDELQEAFSETPRYFGVASGFVESSMNGKFGDATVILMGCNVLAGERLAQAFIDKGASAVVGWDDFVSADHTDAATLSLLRNMLDENLSPQEAAARAMAEVGPDPYYGANFIAYPPGG